MDPIAALSQSEIEPCLDSTILFDGLIAGAGRVANNLDSDNVDANCVICCYRFMTDDTYDYGRGLRNIKPVRITSRIRGTIRAEDIEFSKLLCRPWRQDYGRKDSDGRNDSDDNRNRYDLAEHGIVFPIREPQPKAPTKPFLRLCAHPSPIRHRDYCQGKESD